jgi:hypothetical protein
VHAGAGPTKVKMSGMLSSSSSWIATIYRYFPDAERASRLRWIGDDPMLAKLIATSGLAGAPGRAEPE